jgi:hypothetical protein|tara:strand:+ start:183 stop:686 length:504 start_codon:yes stop_codon:yes gene_type:complete
MSKVIEELKKLHLEDSSDDDIQSEEDDVQTMNVVENKKPELTSMQRMAMAKQRLQSKRMGNKNKAKQKKLKFNVLNETHIMMMYLGSTEAKTLKTQKSSSDFKEYIKNKFIKLHNEYPAIFDKTLEGQMNLDMLNFLCKQQDNLRKGRDQYATDVDVGKAIFDKYAK